jgi:pimeloyl-ACP methyl ester carboxylesterase
MNAHLADPLGKPHEIELSVGPVRYRERGSGPTVVFLHGIVANSALWRRVVPQLADRYRCITPDWPLGSHELGLRAGTDMSLPGLARIVEEFFEALDLIDVTLVANDTGGAVAQWVAVHDPERLGRLILTPCDAFENFLPLPLRHLQVAGRTSAGLRVVGQSLRFRFIQRLPIAFGLLTVRPIDPDAMAAYTTPLRTNAAVRADFARLVRAVSSRYTRDAARRLPAFGKPALVIWSLDDRIFPLRHGHRLAGLMPRAELAVIDDSGAFIPEDRPVELARRIGEFLEDPTSAGRDAESGAVG